MKRLISALMLLTVILGLTGCKTTSQPQAEVSKDENNGTYREHTISISDSSVAFRDALFGADNVLGSSKEQQLEKYEKSLETYSQRTVQLFPEFDSIHEITKYQNRDDVFTLEAEDYECIVLYIHGGAWVQEISVPQASFADKLADSLKAKIVIPLYPLAPQVEYEETYAMLDEVYDMVAAEGKPVIVMGDSAGGTCSLGLVLQRKAANKSLPVKVIALAPCADLSFSNPEIDEIAKVDGMLPKYFCLECAKLWTNGKCLTDPSISPLNGDYKDFPDTMFIVGNYDLLYADNILLMEKMNKAGVNITFLKGNGFWHVFPVFDIEEYAACAELIRIFVNE